MILSLTAVMNGVTLWAISKRLQTHIKSGGHDGRN